MMVNIKQEINNINDLFQNIQELKQVQMNIEHIQELKDTIQLQANMVSLFLLRKYILNEAIVGPMLFRKMIRKFYPLSDNQIEKYEIYQYQDEYSSHKGCYHLLNEKVLNRKGTEFIINGKKYKWEYSVDKAYKWNYVDDFHKDMDVKNGLVRSTSVRRSLMENEFTNWTWELVELIHKGRSSSKYEYRILHLLDNPGFVVQMGIANIDDTIKKLQDISNETYTSDMIESYRNLYKDKGMSLYSYLPLSKEYILIHQDELDWEVLSRNPHIKWDLELINLFIRKYKASVSESEWSKGLNHVSINMYNMIEELLNDDVLSDIEKLYDI